MKSVHERLNVSVKWYSGVLMGLQFSFTHKSVRDYQILNSMTYGINLKTTTRDFRRTTISAKRNYLWLMIGCGLVSSKFDR